jgi:hypothetical protein
MQNLRRIGLNWQIQLVRKPETVPDEQSFTGYKLQGYRFQGPALPVIRGLTTKVLKPVT